MAVMVEVLGGGGGGGVLWVVFGSQGFLSRVPSAGRGSQLPKLFIQEVASNGLTVGLLLVKARRAEIHSGKEPPPHSRSFFSL